MNDDGLEPLPPSLARTRGNTETMKDCDHPLDACDGEKCWHCGWIYSDTKPPVVVLAAEVERLRQAIRWYVDERERYFRREPTASLGEAWATLQHEARR